MTKVKEQENMSPDFIKIVCNKAEIRMRTRAILSLHGAHYSRLITKLYPDPGLSDHNDTVALTV